ncbi:NAD/NADP octopine/nopaline dehydrogenase family protein [Paenarthrobacter sp. NPDC090520]|uniref:NAD/NADP octopine/nopaline dehydrogenase family protein n=1 Tax=Paenarthrobacter sp. NPDC090520 TaxID=3364382 RepID=UPI0038167470
MTRIGIVGCGSTGLALAAHLMQQGATVQCMVDQGHALLHRLRHAGRISLTGHLGIAHFPAPPYTDDYASLTGCDVVFVATTADRHLTLARHLAPVLRSGQLCVLVTGYVNGVAAFENALAAAGATVGSACVAALNTTPHLSYASGDGSVHVAAVKTWFEVSASTTAASKEGAIRLAEWFPAASPARHQFSSSLNNPNPTAHVPAAVLNAVAASKEAHGLVPPQGAFHLGDFGAPALEALRNVLDAERLAVMRALGLGAHFVGRNDFGLRAYGPGAREPDPPRTGHTFQRRFVTEDVPCGLVPIESLGIWAGIRTPSISALISFICALEGRDFRVHPTVGPRLVGWRGAGRAHQPVEIGASP